MPRDLGSDIMYVSPDAALRFWSHRFCNFDPILLNSCRELVSKDAIVWDIGANVGLFTFPAAYLAGRAGRVVAVEPDDFCVKLLEKL